MSALISVSELSETLRSDRPPAVLDVRWALTGPPGRSRYDVGHIPGARFVDLDKDLSAPPGGSGQRYGGGRHPLPDAEAFSQAMRQAGVWADRAVVVYGEQDGFGPARAWWCLRYFGHTAVQFLDGGFPAWMAAGLQVESTTPDVAPGDFEAQPGGMALLDADGTARMAREGVLLDARAGERYRGESELVDPVAGHIPGALNAPTDANTSGSGGFRAAAELRKRFAGLGVKPESPVGVYCGSGVSAAHEVLALELAGIPAALYVGSWSDWVSDPSRPVATGTHPDPPGAQPGAQQSPPTGGWFAEHARGGERQG
ncbi:sulfurtransferase [Actinopolymorpha sp. B9G3]|uniref:sulfurtransferase n=1 Tax=Actinopolymorpha sp. B9G3 TaxID=3158970 RepID=UPI0032D8BD3E